MNSPYLDHKLNPIEEGFYGAFSGGKLLRVVYVSLEEDSIVLEDSKRGNKL